MMHDDEQLAGNILLDDGDDAPHEDDMPFLRQPLASYGSSPGSSPAGSDGGGYPTNVARGLFGADLGEEAPATRGLAPRRADGHPQRTPTRTPSPVYAWTPQKVSLGDEDEFSEARLREEKKSITNRASLESDRGAGSVSARKVSDGRGGAQPAEAFQQQQAQATYSPQLGPQQPPQNPHSPQLGPQQPPQVGGQQSQPQQQMPFPPFYNPYWSGSQNPAEFYGLMMMQQAAAAQAAQADGKMPQMDPAMWQMIMNMQAQGLGAPGQPGGQGAGAAGQPLPAAASQPQDRDEEPLAVFAPGPRGGGGRGGGGQQQQSRQQQGGLQQQQPHAQGGGGQEGNNKKKKGGRGQDVVAVRPEAAPSRDRGGKGERRRRGAGDEEGGGKGGREPGGGGGKNKSLDVRPQSSSPVIEQLKMKDRPIELADLTWHIGEIAQDQYGSRLIQQKLEVANDEEKAQAFKAILQKMPQLTTDVFGNYVIQKFFEHGNPEQRRIMAEQLVGQVLKMSLQMYGCRVVQKALDSVQIEQQCLLISELRGHVLKCIEDQHGNHVIQKCIERLPTDKINFIVEAFDGQASRMAKHCYGCRVIQRLIEYCSSAQISALLDEVLRFCMDLATDQYGNYVVQHVMEHSSRPGDRNAILHIVYKNILTLSCHKYASNVVEKALACGTYEERASIVMAIVGDTGGDSMEPNPPLFTMMRDRFGNYIVQRTINIASGPTRDLLIHRLQEQMPVLKKSSTYGKHIISALERAQANPM